MSADAAGAFARTASHEAYRRASLFDRLDARFLDLCWATGVTGVVFALLLLVTGDLGRARFWAPVAAWMVLATIEAACVTYKGATPGKAMKSMYVVDSVSYTLPSRTQVLIRVVMMQTVAFSALLWWPVPVLFTLLALITPGRLFVHDLVARTKVVRA